MNNELLVIVIIVLLFLVIGLFVAGGLWLAFQKSRLDRQKKLQDRTDYSQPPLPPPSSIEEPARDPDIRWGEPSAIENSANPAQVDPSMIRWGDLESANGLNEANSGRTESEPIQWGDELDTPSAHNPDKDPPPGPEEIVVCPICRQEIEKDSSAAFVCQCSVVYHQKCLTEFEQCPNCRNAI